jgi:hypothetical protein
VTFKPAFTGQKTIFARAWNSVGATSGWIPEGSWMVSQNEPPVPIAAIPYSGSGDRQTFSFTFADPNGAADLEKIEAIIALDPGNEQACHLIVDRRASLVSLEGGSSVPLRTRKPVASPLCEASNVHIAEKRGRMLRLSADVRFTPAFSGRRNIFLKSSDKSGLESDWLWAGTWNTH